MMPMQGLAQHLVSVALLVLQLVARSAWVAVVVAWFVALAWFAEGS
mgnify:FL=1